MKPRHSSSVTKSMTVPSMWRPLAGSTNSFSPPCSTRMSSGSPAETRPIMYFSPLQPPACTMMRMPWTGALAARIALRTASTALSVSWIIPPLRPSVRPAAPGRQRVHL